ncbi:DNA (cytosine-5-)-methyltransferase [Kitasatospora cineracea]|uniref:DNA cytosine methyltransferase n=1 Tax=Kitasatospora cineracea TaxID=88074 RepID=UPI0034424679
MGRKYPELTSIEICAGAGGQAVGLHKAGFKHLALVEIDQYAVKTLEKNVNRQPKGSEDPWGWERDNCLIFRKDVKEFQPAEEFPDLEQGQLALLAGGVPCPPFSIAGKQLGQDDERDLFPRMLALVDELRPQAVMIENVRGLLEPSHKFRPYRKRILKTLRESGYVVCGWEVLEAASFGVPQLRPRAILVAIRKDLYRGFTWPKRTDAEGRTVFDALDKSMRKRFGMNAGKAPGLDSEELREAAKAKYKEWREKARPAVPGVAPTLVGGSKKHGGADLGPTRAKAAWKALGVDAMGVANDEEQPNLQRDLFGANGPMITVRQAALIQGFPEDWEFEGGKTARYRQIGNAFPPPVAQAVGEAIIAALRLPRDLPPVEEPVLDDDRYPEDGELSELPLFADSIVAVAVPVQDTGVLPPAGHAKAVAAPVA